MPKGEPLDRLAVRRAIETVQFPFDYLSPLGQAVIASVVSNTYPTYSDISDALKVPGLTRKMIAGYMRTVTFSIPTIPHSGAEYAGSRLDDANERYMAMQMLSQLGKDGAPKEGSSMYNKKNVLLASVCERDTINHLKPRMYKAHTTQVTDGGHGYMKDTAKDLNILPQELTQLHLIMMNDLERAITFPDNSHFQKHLEHLSIVQRRKQKAESSILPWNTDYKIRIEELLQLRTKLTEKPEKDDFDDALLRAYGMEIERLSRVATQFLNITLPISKTSGVDYLYLDALQAVAHRKIGKRVGKSVEDNLKLTSIALNIADLKSSEDLYRFIISGVLPSSWKAEVYTELLPLFSELYANPYVFSLTDIDVLRRLASPEKPSMTEIEQTAVNGLKGSVISMLRFALLYGQTRQKEYFPFKPQ